MEALRFGYLQQALGIGGRTNFSTYGFVLGGQGEELENLIFRHIFLPERLTVYLQDKVPTGRVVSNGGGNLSPDRSSSRPVSRDPIETIGRGEGFLSHPPPAGQGRPDGIPTRFP
jgi:hypothetical protein